METQENLHQSLKNQTLELHEKAHSIPYIKHLLNNDIPLESYVGHLRTFAIIYGTLERQLALTKQDEIKGFLDDYVPKLPLLLADLKTFDSKNVKDIMPAVSKALHVADKILLCSERDPFKLIGFLYTLDGSLNGGSVFKTHLTRTFNLENHQGISYFLAFNNDYKRFWKDFTDKINNIVSKTDKEDVLASAKEIFYDLIDIYESLDPFEEKDLQNHITSLNPEAGNFPISSNPLEIEASIIAGQKCWYNFPYYEQRYGERGKRFMISDSVWLLNLCELSQELTNSQVKWLADYLAKRGMPTYTMEIQLEYMYYELVKRIPENEAKYKKLFNASEHLKSRRNKYLSSATFEKCNLLFSEICKELKVSGHNLRNTGKLIASSIADDENGINESETDFRNWMINPDFFSDEWIMAVKKAYTEINNQTKS